MINFKLKKHPGIRRQSGRGFTIVETLVAITVLMIAIAGPLVVASKGLTAAIYARDQMTATFLAQESMEFIKNFRDNHLHSPDGNPWLTDGSFDLTRCTQASACDASPLDKAINNNDGFFYPCSSQSAPLSLASACPLYSVANGYVHEPGTSATPFYRHFYLVTVNNNIGEVTLHVVVDWKEGTIPYQIDLASELVDTTR